MWGVCLSQIVKSPIRQILGTTSRMINSQCMATQIQGVGVAKPPPPPEFGVTSGVGVLFTERLLFEDTVMEKVDAWLVECDSVVDSIEGKFDAAEDLWQMREQRAGCL